MSRRRGMRWTAVGLAAVRVSTSGTRSLGARGTARERQQSDVARALDGHAQPALMAGADAGHAARKNFAALLDELRKNVGALVVDHVHLFDAKLTDFLFAEVLALAARTSTGTAGAATGTTFATWTTRTALAAWTTVTSRAGVAAARTVPAFALGSAGGSLGLGLFWFLCHNVVPFSFQSRGKPCATKFLKFSAGRAKAGLPQARPPLHRKFTNQEHGSKDPPLHKKTQQPRARV
jgi:hypothetical protein